MIIVKLGAGLATLGRPPKAGGLGAPLVRGTCELERAFTKGGGFYVCQTLGSLQTFNPASCGLALEQLGRPGGRQLASVTVVP